MVRLARWAEACFAVVAILMSLTFTVAPAGTVSLIAIAHWYLMIAAAAWLAYSLDESSPRGQWVTAVVLSSYFVLKFLWVLAARFASGALVEGYFGPGAALSYALAGSLVWAQAIVAIQCWRARSLWMTRSPRPKSAYMP